MGDDRRSGGHGRHAMLLPVYLPTALLAFGQGLLMPTLPLFANSFDVGYSLVSLAVGAAALGTLVMDVPTGMLLSRIGRKRSMLIGTALVALSTFAASQAHFFPELVVYRLLAGAGTALWGISRHAYITDVAPPAERGRSIAVFGGINRIGVFGGPVVGGSIGAIFGLGVPFLVTGLMATLALIIAFFFVNETGSTVISTRGMRWQMVGQLVKTHWADLSSAGVAQTFAQMIRAGRQLIIPLFGVSIGLDVFQIGQILSIAAIVDMVLFVPAGIIMDRFGRKFAAVPSFTIMAIGMALIPLTFDYWTLLSAAALIGFGNGIGSGTMMTLGADLAPPGATGEFLGLWRLIGDAGGAGGPLVVGSLADLVGLGWTSVTLAGAGLIAAAMLGLLVRETRHEPATSTASSTGS